MTDDKPVNEAQRGDRLVTDDKDQDWGFGLWGSSPKVPAKDHAKVRGDKDEDGK